MIWPDYVSRSGVKSHLRDEVCGWVKIYNQITVQLVGQFYLAVHFKVNR